MFLTILTLGVGWVRKKIECSKFMMRADGFVEKKEIVGGDKVAESYSDGRMRGCKVGNPITYIIDWG